MAQSADIDINAGARLDRLPICSFHWRILALIGAGMFLDAFDIYLAGGVLGTLLKEGWSTLELNATFVSATFVGMTIGAWFSGILGDRFGRRFSYQVNFAIFGLASIAAAFAPNMTVLIGLRFIIGIGLGAEIVVGYATLTEFVPASSRGRWIGLLAVITNFSLFASSMVGLWVIPNFGWRYMFGLVGILAMFVWFLRKSMPESPRWLAANGRADEAEQILSAIEAEAAKQGSLPPIVSVAAKDETPGPVWRLFRSPYLGRDSARQPAAHRRWFQPLRLHRLASDVHGEGRPQRRVVAGTELGDIAETQATARIFGDKMPVSSLKSYMGHTLGACGALEAWLSIEMMREDWFAPTINLNEIDDRCGRLDYIRGKFRPLKTDYVMSNNFAFGGVNTSLIFRRWREK